MKKRENGIGLNIDNDKVYKKNKQGIKREENKDYDV